MPEKRYSDEELTALAQKIVGFMPKDDDCKLTAEQQAAVIDLITAKKKVIRWTLYVIGALVLWALKDVYYYILHHIAWGGK